MSSETELDELFERTIHEKTNDEEGIFQRVDLKSKDLIRFDLMCVLCTK